MDNQRKKDIAFWIMIIVVISLSIYAFFWIKSESFECMANPLVYGVSQFEASDGEFSCSCSSPNAKDTLIVTKDNISLLNSYNDIYLK